MLLNARSLGRKRPRLGAVAEHLAHPPISFDAGKSVPRRLEAVAYIGGRPVARHAVDTASAAAVLRVNIGDAGVAPVAGDLIFARAEWVDVGDRPAVDSAAPVTFSATGAYEIIGEAVFATEAGGASVFVRVLDPRARGAILARSRGLKSGAAPASPGSGSPPRRHAAKTRPMGD